MAMAHSLIAQPGFFRTKQESHLAERSRGANQVASGSQRMHRMFEGAFSNRGCTHDQVAIRHRLLYGREHSGRLQQVVRIDGRSCSFERNGVVVYEAEVRKSEPVHRPSDRANIIRIPSTHQNQTNPFHPFILTQAQPRNVYGGKSAPAGSPV
jgi:hypothetical protein